MNIYKATYHQIVYHQHGYHVPNSYFNRMMAVWPFTKRQITPLKHLLQTTHWSVKQYFANSNSFNRFISCFSAFISTQSIEIHVSFSIFHFSQRQLNIKGYQCSTNLEFVLFKHNVKNVSRSQSNSHIPFENEIKLRW